MDAYEQEQADKQMLERFVQEDEPLIDPEQTSLFAEDEHKAWADEWKGMPEFDQKNLQPFKSIYVHFENSRDVAQFAAMVDQKITPTTRYIWFPEPNIVTVQDKRFYDDES